MRRQNCGARLAPVAAIAALFGIAVPAFSTTAPTSADLTRCAAIAAPDARLACYDALAGRAADRTPPAASVTPAAPPTPAAPAAPLTPAAPPAPAAPVAAAAAPTASAAAGDPKNFGLPAAPVHKAAENSTALQAHIAKIVDNRIGRGYAVLDNGQTWVFVDAADDAGLSPGDPITIKKGSLGSFVMITPSRRSYHVRRTQ